MSTQKNMGCVVLICGKTSKLFNWQLFFQFSIKEAAFIVFLSCTGLMCLFHLNLHLKVDLVSCKIRNPILSVFGQKKK